MTSAMVVALLVRVTVEVDKELIQRPEGEFTTVAANGGSIVGIVLAEDFLVARESSSLEMVRETQPHAPERTGIGQEPPRDGFASIAPQIGDVTAQRIPDHRLVITLKGRSVDPAALDTHRQRFRERVVHSEQHLLADQPVGQDTLETACRGREILANVVRVGQPFAGANGGWDWRSSTTDCHRSSRSTRSQPPRRHRA